MNQLRDCYSRDALLVERRHSIRYEIHTPILFVWEELGGKKLHAEGVSRDISDVGLYILSDQCPPLKGRVDVEVLFGTSTLQNIWLRGGMRVVRVEGTFVESGVCGFAIAGNPLLEESAAQT